MGGVYSPIKPGSLSRVLTNKSIDTHARTDSLSRAHISNYIPIFTKYMRLIYNKVLTLNSRIRGGACSLHRMLYPAQNISVDRNPNL